MSNDGGSSYIEVVVSIGIVGILAGSILPSFPNLLATTNKIYIDSKLMSAAEYVTGYVNRWDQFSPSAKPLPLDDYQEGDSLELSGETCINALQWADPLLETGLFDNHYKTIIRFFETDRQNRAVAHITVWYDDNLDDEVGATENALVVSTIVAETRYLQ